MSNSLSPSSHIQSMMQTNSCRKTKTRLDRLIGWQAGRQTHRQTNRCTRRKADRQTAQRVKKVKVFFHSWKRWFRKGSWTSSCIQLSSSSFRSNGNSMAGKFLWLKLYTFPMISAQETDVFGCRCHCGRLIIHGGGQNFPVTSLLQDLCPCIRKHNRLRIT